MDWVAAGLAVFLLVVIVLILLTLYNLAPLGDERRKLIQEKAAAYTFTVTIVYLLIEIGVMAYTNLATAKTYDGLNPFIVLIVFSILYLLSLLRTKRRYGG